MCWRDRTSRQPAYHQHSTAPLKTSKGELWECAVLTQSVKEQGPKIRYYQAVRIHKISTRGMKIKCCKIYRVSLCWMTRWYGGNLFQVQWKIYSLPLCGYLISLDLCISLSLCLSPSSLYFYTAAIAQSSAQLSGCGGEKQVFLLHQVIFGKAGIQQELLNVDKLLPCTRPCTIERYRSTYSTGYIGLGWRSR